MGIAFTERDVSKDEQALAELEALGVLSTPVTLIDGEVVIGFNRAKLEMLLADARVHYSSQCRAGYSSGRLRGAV